MHRKGAIGGMLVNGHYLFAGMTGLQWNCS